MHYNLLDYHSAGNFVVVVAAAAVIAVVELAAVAALQSLMLDFLVFVHLIISIKL